MGWPSRTSLPVSQQVQILFLVQLSNWRWSWPQMLLTGILAPMLTVLTLGFYASNSGSSAPIYALSGSITMALLFETQNKIASNFAFMRHNGALEFLASNPVSRACLMLATLLAFSLLAIPSVVIITLLGAEALGVALRPDLGALLLAPVLMLPSGGLGALIGNVSRSLEQASSLSLATTLVMLGLGPVAVPGELLPPVLAWAGYLNPAYYAASLIRAGLLGADTSDIYRDAVMLLVMSAPIWAVAVQTLRWRT